LNSNGLTLNLIPEQPVSIEVGLPFETGGPEEIDINNWSDVDLTKFSITIKFQLEPNSGKVGLVTSKEWINTDVSIDSIPGYQGIVEGKIKSTVNQKVYEALNDHSKDLNQLLTRWLVGGDFYVVGVSSDNQSLTIDYIIPPGQLEPFPENPQPPLDPGLLANIDHIVVLMMENRSFDHMLGYLSKEGGSDGKKRMDVDGLHGGGTNADGKGHNYLSFPLPNTTFEEIPDHSYLPVLNQINGGKMDGFVTSFVAKFPATDNPGKIMGYHTAAHVPVYDALAREFLICQRWFAAHPGPTFCNRFYTLTGRLNRNADKDNTWQLDNPHGNDFAPVLTRTIFDHLTDHGVSWHYYETVVENSGENNPYCFLRMFARYSTDFNNYIRDLRDPVKGFFASAQAGTLPSVSFIDPDFIDVPPGNDDAPPADIANGQHLIGQVVNAVVNSPKWNKTLLVITYDEHGGFYDHDNPLLSGIRNTAKPVSGAKPELGMDHYGVRVPAFVISPWVDRGAVSNVVFDHTSIAKTIARRFMSANPPDMGERMAAANDLSKVLRSTVRQDKPTIPVPPAPNAALARQAAPVAESDDFKEVLRAMRSRYPVRR
jgi:phospholipase C